MRFGLSLLLQGMHGNHTRDVIGEFVSAKAEEAGHAIDAAHEALPRWRALSGFARGEFLRKAADHLESRLDEVARAMVRENGKTITEARGETARGVALLRFYAAEGVRSVGDVIPSVNPRTFVYTTRAPLGGREHHRAMELPHRHTVLEDCAGSGLRQYGRFQTCQRDTSLRRAGDEDLRAGRDSGEPPEAELSFARVREGFEAAARDGPLAEVTWLDGAARPVRPLVLDELLTMARQGLRMHGLEAEGIERWLGIVEQRVRRGTSGSCWQRAWTARRGRDFRRLVADYCEHQRSGAPVHEWHA